MEGKRPKYKALWLQAKGKIASLEKKIEGLKREVEELEKEASDYLERLKWLKAEFENYKKRSLKERARLGEIILEDLLKEILPIMDDVERALQAAEKVNSSSFTEGLRLILSSFKKVLENQGVEEIKTKGEEFNPELHEAIGIESREDFPDNVIVEEFRKGYKLKDRVLRPAMVKVNKKLERDSEGEKNG